MNLNETLSYHTKKLYHSLAVADYCDIKRVCDKNAAISSVSGNKKDLPIYCVDKGDEKAAAVENRHVYHQA